MPVQRMMLAPVFQLPAGAVAGMHGFRYRLIRGGWDAANNVADMHVDAKGAGAGPTTAEELSAYQDVHQALLSRDGVVPGRLEQHPTGAAVVKMTIDGLAGVFGDMFSFTKGFAQQKFRKAKETFWGKPERGQDALEEDVHAEHFHMLDSLVGRGLHIRAICAPSRTRCKTWLMVLPGEISV